MQFKRYQGKSWPRVLLFKIFFTVNINSLNATVLPLPLVLILFGETVFPLDYTSEGHTTLCKVHRPMSLSNCFEHAYQHLCYREMISHWVSSIGAARIFSGGREGALYSSPKSNDLFLVITLFIHDYILHYCSFLTQLRGCTPPNSAPFLPHSNKNA